MILWFFMIWKSLRDDFFRQPTSFRFFKKKFLIYIYIVDSARDMPVVGAF